MNILPVKQQWEYAIDQLHTILTDKIISTDQQASVSERRLVWIVDPSSLHIDVAEQLLRKNGTWTAGRSIALKRVHYGDPQLDYLTHFDQAAIAGLRSNTHGWYSHERWHCAQ